MYPCAVSRLRKFVSITSYKTVSFSSIIRHRFSRRHSVRFTYSSHVRCGFAIRRWATARCRQSPTEKLRYSYSGPPWRCSAFSYLKYLTKTFSSYQTVIVTLVISAGIQVMRRLQSALLMARGIPPTEVVSPNFRNSSFKNYGMFQFVDTCLVYSRLVPGNYIQDDNVISYLRKLQIVTNSPAVACATSYPGHLANPYMIW